MQQAFTVQLAAGAEHVIAGKTVRVNLAGPRPELPLLYMDPSQTQPMLIPQTAGKCCMRQLLRRAYVNQCSFAP